MLFDAPDDAISAVSEDLAEGFKDIFVGIEEGAAGARAVGPFRNLPIGADSISVVAWEWKVQHIGSLPGPHGTPPTSLTVTMRGVTIIDGRRDTPRYVRYIDWL